MAPAGPVMAELRNGQGPLATPNALYVLAAGDTTTMTEPGRTTGTLRGVGAP